jgi:hypothetical protein
VADDTLRRAKEIHTKPSEPSSVFVEAGASIIIWRKTDSATKMPLKSKPTYFYVCGFGAVSPHDTFG